MKKFIFLFTFCFLWILQIHTKEKTICLNMIVKNESKVIKRCLDSVKSIIDYWVIVDTGSTDGTQEMIKNYMKDIPGELHEDEWINFEHNRNVALKLAKDKADYILFMDADDEMIIFKDFKKPRLDKDFYHIEIKHGQLKYDVTKIVKSDLNWQWKGVLHEYLHSNIANTRDSLKNVYIKLGHEGCRSQDPDIYKKDAKIFKKALEKDPNNSRYVFYLAQSYRDSNNLSKAIKWYQKRVSLQGWDEEVFCSLLQIAKLQQRLSFSLDDVISSYFKAHHFRSTRLEPVYYLAEIFNNQKKYDLAYELLKGFDFAHISKVRDILFRTYWIEDYGLLYQLSICTYHLGKFQECFEICMALLNKENVFEWFRASTEQRLKALMDRLNNRFNLLKIIFEDNHQTQIVCTDDSSQDDFEYKKVLLDISIRNTAYILPLHLKTIENLDYDKKYITVYINTNSISDHTLAILEDWKSKNKHKYNNIILDNNEGMSKDTNTQNFNLNEIKNKSLQKTKELDCDYCFTVDCYNFIFPCTLKQLIKKDKPIIAPMLTSFPEIDDTYSNYFCDISENGYYKSHPNYLKILKSEMIGTFKVPVVHATYLIKKEVIDKLSYTDGTNDYAFIIFSKTARNNGIDQYICNENNFGLFLHFFSIPSAIEEKRRLDQYLEN